MFCPNCGVAISVAGSFCANCGKNLAYLTAKQDKSVVAEQAEKAQSAGISPESSKEINEPATAEVKEEIAASQEETAKTVIEEAQGAAPRIAKPVSEKVYFCNQCGTAVYPKDNYCYQCGKKTQKEYYRVSGKRKKLVFSVSLFILCVVTVLAFYKLTT